MMTRVCEEAAVELICLAGFMRILTAEFCDRWAGRLLNIHPSLLPSFKGATATKDAVEAGVKIHGATKERRPANAATTNVISDTFLICNFSFKGFFQFMSE